MMTIILLQRKDIINHLLFAITMRKNNNNPWIVFHSIDIIMKKNNEINAAFSFLITFEFFIIESG